MGEMNRTLIGSNAEYLCVNGDEGIIDQWLWIYRIHICGVAISHYEQLDADV